MVFFKVMQRTIFIFHGTEGYPEENWFPWLKGQLEELGHRVIVPHFLSPPGEPASILEWFTVLEPYRKLIDENAILIGHSLGGLFALRVLESLNHAVFATALVAAPVGVRPILNYDRDAAFCGFDLDWQKISSKSQHFIIFQSDDDPHVSLGNGELLADKLGARLSFIPKAGHFNAAAGYDEFTELLGELSKLGVNDK